MTVWLDKEYNYTAWRPLQEEFEYFRKKVKHAGDKAKDFTLPALDGGNVTLSDLRGKPTVIEFGSGSCGFCVAEFPLMEALAEEFEDRANFVFVYTRETHPERASWPRHESIGQKRDQARHLTERFRSRRTILIDDLEGEVHRLYSGIPNMTWIVDHAGRVAYKAGWTIVADIREGLEEVIKLRESKHHGPTNSYYRETMSRVMPRRARMAEDDWIEAS